MKGDSIDLADGRGTDGVDPVAHIWEELKRHLEQRSKDLSAEVRRYPTPIAHCDDQLPKLIAQRDHAIRQLRLMAAIDPTAPPGARVERRGALEEYLSATSGDPDDEIEGTLRSRLTQEMAARRLRQ